MDVQELSLMFTKDSPLGRSQELGILISQILNDERVVYSKDPYGDKLSASVHSVPRIINPNPAVKSKPDTYLCNGGSVCRTNFNSQELSLIKRETESITEFTSHQRSPAKFSGKVGNYSVPLQKRIKQVPSYHSYQGGVTNQGCRDIPVRPTTPQINFLIPEQECEFGHKVINTATQKATVKTKTCKRTEPVTDECFVAKSVDYVEVFTDLSRKQMQACPTENQVSYNNDKPGQFIYPPVYQVYLKGKNPLLENRNCSTQSLTLMNKVDTDAEKEAYDSLNKVHQVKGMVNTYVEKEASSLFNNDRRISNGNKNENIGRQKTTSLVKVQPVKGTVVDNTGREPTSFIEKVLQSSKSNTSGNTEIEATIVNKRQQTYKANKTVGSVATSFIDKVERSEFSGCFSSVQNKSSIIQTENNKRSSSRDVCPLCGQSWEGFISQGSQKGGPCNNHICSENLASKVSHATTGCSPENSDQLCQGSGCSKSGHHDFSSSGTGIGASYECDKIETISEDCQHSEPIEQDENDDKFPNKVPIEIGKLGEEEIERMIAALVEANQVFKEFPRTDEPKKQQLMRSMNSYLETREASSGSSSGELRDPLAIEETRRRVLEYSVKYVEMKISESVRFAKKIPGFTALPLEDQANLIRESRTESALVGGMRGINADKKVFSTHEGSFFSMEDMKLVFDENLLKEKIILSTKIAKLNMSPEEEAILRAITITATDRCKLQAREEVEDLHNRLMSCLIHVIKKHGTESISRRLGHLTDVLCSCRNVTEVDLVQVKKIFLEWPNYSQYKLVEEFLD